MKSDSNQRFYVKNLDCPACAAKIENGLQEIDTVAMAIVDFANLKLHVETDDIKIEPQAERTSKAEIASEFDWDGDLDFTPDDLIDIAVYNGLHFNGARQEGVVFHLGALLPDQRYAQLP